MLSAVSLSTPETSADPAPIAAPGGGLRLRAEGERSRRILRLEGRLCLADADTVFEALRRESVMASGGLRVDLAALEVLEGGGAAALIGLRDALCREGSLVYLAGAEGEVAQQLALYETGAAGCEIAPGPQRVGMLDHAGRATAEIASIGLSVLAFIGDLALSLTRLVRRPREARWADLPAIAERAGADGLPITLLINYLVGLIIALQSALQMQRFGAEIFVADLVGLSTTRELAPLMTAILVAGRSGAAFAAELGTMRVNEEIDALRALRIDPLAYLVVPRVLALVFVVPILTLLGDLIGIAGGLTIAVTSLDIGWETFLRRIASAVGLADVAVGLLKSVAFAAMIGLVACQRGLATRGGATGVGRSTTSAVVTILFLLIVLDALFTALFTALGI